MKIVFVHNVYNRFKTLRATVEQEKRYFPDSLSIIAFNDLDPSPALAGISGIEFVGYIGLTHKIGCTNGCISGIKAALRHNPDVIIFTHDDVYIYDSYAHKVKELIAIISEGQVDAICRRPLPSEKHGVDYYMMEVFYISGKAAKEVFGEQEIVKNEELIDRDVRGSISPEVHLARLLKNKKIRVGELQYIHIIDDYNITLGEGTGFFHKNIGKRGWTD